ncbi:hypothetical protein FSP39_003640 [Pinctada imbricata]|uniref:Uncharacterized protein n=1 Tax=Pinctada imbricata TaxID=66713 RepID=A0AA88XXY4_PINIB|nr:hypothetical protein FSP39_003640 [Pinctada imbricata]
MILGILIATIAVLLTAAFRYRRRRITRPFEHTYIVITGCDTGFGRLAAEKFDSLGMQVFAGCLLEKSLGELKDSCSNKICPVLLDVTKQDHIDHLLNAVTREIPDGLGLTGLINNAGILGPCGITESLKSENFLSTLRVNFFGMVDVTKALLPLLRKGKGRIINTSSIGGKYGAQFLATYYASKHAIESYSDSLRRELYHDDISVHIIEPAGFKTDKLLDPKKIEEDSNKYFRTLPTESQEFYGIDLLNRTNAYLRNIKEMFDNKPSKVVDAFQHALTSSHPLLRYKVGKGASMFLAMTYYLPDWLMDVYHAYEFPTAGTGR